ncbi:hypothetical protein LP422_21645 [Janibacter limosus]|uniref:Uncharacterized protein n=1 Tax=Janibacter limosus TaxID=53458 RepID=A0AC61U492_9MICO|nr:hypothetical protein [Janibacter limosus]UUZ44844.1 hypothetical protein LP422_21645 [Janibacter limosus]
MTDQKDPTGMRHLLASLKESGPMPADLSDRIRASLADEHAARGGTTDDAATDDAGHESGFWGAMDEPGRSPFAVADRWHPGSSGQPPRPWSHWAWAVSC